MTRISCPLGLLALTLAGCGPAPGEDDPADTSDTTADPDLQPGDRPTWWVDGQDGFVVYRHRGRDIRSGREQVLLGLFGDDPGDSVIPPLCAVTGELCYRALPTDEGSAVVPQQTSFDPGAVGFTWVGDELQVGPHTLKLRIDQATGMAFYGAVLPRYEEGELSVSGGGEWGPFSQSAALSAPPDLGLSNATTFLHLNYDPTPRIEWTPGAGTLYLEVRGPREYHQIRRLDDGAGSMVFDSAPLGALEEGDQVHLDFYRIEERAFELGPNRLRTFSVSHQYVLAGSAFPASCKIWQALEPTSASGVYLIQPNPDDPPQPVWCDMVTDGGGWTLVASTNGTTLNDEASDYYADLATLYPTSGHEGIWNGLRSVISGDSDIRFTCKLDVAQADWTVDLSFYDIGWYREITTGTDAQSCFSENNGAGADIPPPARRNNLTGEFLPVGSLWLANGYLEGEDSCTDTGDFTVDFNDRGMDSNQSDGTDWGEDDHVKKCGVSGISGGAWFIYVREPS